MTDAIAAATPLAMTCAGSNARARFAQAAGRGVLCLPTCRDCGAVQYPAQDACVRCLSDRLEDTPIDGAGTLVSWTALHRSNEARFAGRLPLRIGSVRLDAGPLVIAFLPEAPDEAAASLPRVEVGASCDVDGRPVLTARVLHGQ